MQKGLTTQGITPAHALHILIALLMIGTGIYLTSHYYSTVYPTTLGGGSSLCDISSFWNCDVATFSPLAAPGGVPISVFGVITGLVLLGTSIFPSEDQERTASALSRYNLIGCVALFAYSLIALGSLCPMCSFYYVMSACSALLFWRRGISTWVPSGKPILVWAVVGIIAAVGFNRHTAGQAEKQHALAGQVVTQYLALTMYGDPDTESPFKIHAATPNFADAPIRVSVFSDFQCPFCKMVAEQIPQLVRRYGSHMNVQYLFYPLDAACNPAMKGGMHAFACRAAMLSACYPTKFAEIHDEIFAAQEGLNLDVLQGIAKKHKLEACFNDQATKPAVEASMNQAAKYNLKSTPTIIINGRKIEGSIPNPQFHAIFEELLKQKQ